MHVRRRLLLVIIIAVFAAGIFVGRVFPFKPVEPETLNVDHETLNAAFGTASSSLIPSHNPGTLRVLVSHVIDGDTVAFSSGERVRLIGIDAPERGACFFEQSKQALEALVLGKEVSAARDQSERDRYGRLLYYLFRGDVLVNLAMVEKGAARAYRYPPDTSYAAMLSEAEKAARTQNLGLWSSCTKDISVDQRSYQRLSASTDCQIKGNISSSGEKIYHLSGCGSYEKTRIDEEAGERWFCNENEAQTAGWRKAGNCP